MKKFFEIKDEVKKFKLGAKITTNFFKIAEVKDAVKCNRNVLIAVDSILPALISKEPEFAGWSVVIATHSDIVAAGGEPLSFLLSVCAPNRNSLKKIITGVKKGTELLKIKVEGGHTIIGEEWAVTGVMTGKLLNTKKFTIKEGDKIGLISRLNGKTGTPFFPSWNSFHQLSSDDVIRMRKAVLTLHKKNFITFAKDISSGGILGTCAIALENKKLGGTITIDSIPKPESISLLRWLRSFHSFGFIVFYKDKNTDIIKKICHNGGLTFARIGEVKSGKKMTIIYRGKEITFIDFEKEKIIG